MHSLQKIKLYYKYLHDTLADSLRHRTLTINSTIYIHFIRRCNYIHIAGTNHIFAERRLRNNLPKIINTTPNSVKEKLVTHMCFRLLRKSVHA